MSNKISAFYKPIKRGAVDLSEDISKKGPRVEENPNSPVKETSTENSEVKKEVKIAAPLSAFFKPVKPKNENEIPVNPFVGKAEDVKLDIPDDKKIDNISNKSTNPVKTESSEQNSSPAKPDANTSKIDSSALAAAVAATVTTKSLPQIEKAKLRGGNQLSDPNFDPLAFDISSYIAPDGSITYQLLTDAFDQISLLKGAGTGSATMVRNILCSTIRLLIVYSPEDLVPALYLTMNKVAPDYEGIELGLGDMVITGAITSAFNRTAADIKAEMSSGKAADLGEVAFNSRSRQSTIVFSSSNKPKQRLTVRGVFAQFRALAATSGKGSVDSKKSDIQKMLLAAQGSEVKFVVRTLQRKMRIGVASLSLLTSLSHAFVLTRPPHNGMNTIADIRFVANDCAMTKPADVEAEKKVFESAVRAAYCEQPSLDHLIARLMAGDDEHHLAKHCSIQTGIPVAPMLAKPTKGISEVLDRFTNCNFTCEFKYDGERAQVHYVKGKPLAVYSRNSENLTGKYPDLLEAIETALVGSAAQSLVLDCEAVAYDTEKHEILPFQELIKRKRKDVKIEDIKVRVCLFAFDCMLFDGESLLKTPFLERRSLLRKHLKEVPGKFLYAIGEDVLLTDNKIKTVSDDLADGSDDSKQKDKIFDPSEVIQRVLDEAIKGNCEGLMVKTLTQDATYEPSKRSFKWLKVKKDYVDGMTDSIDVVPIGAFYGTGKRAGKYGGYLLAVFNAQEGRYETCCKIGTGFTDEFLAESTAFFNDAEEGRILSSKPNNYLCPSELEPDVWLSNCQVWEIKGADMTISPKHTAGIGLVSDEKGIAIRFPRFLRIRDDKGVEDTTSNEQIAEMYNAQFAHKKPVNYDDDSDFAE